MKDEQLFEEVEGVVIQCNQPYSLNHDRVRKALAKIHKWQVNPNNDCLRARGDIRWQKACELSSRLQTLLEPF